MKSEILKKLRLHNYRFKQSSKGIEVKLGLNQIVEINFTDNGLVEIKDKLVGWNPLSGMLKLELKFVVIYQTILMIITALILFLVLKYNDALEFNKILDIVLIISLFGWGYIIYWTNYYNVKAEVFKATIQRWLDSIT